MNVVDWLKTNAPGFRELPRKDRDAIMHFSFLWSFFESKVLNRNASANAICAFTAQWASCGGLDVTPFESSLTYFRHRYFDNGEVTENFQGLRLRANDKPELVKAVLKGENTDPKDAVSAMLIIVYRFRNNLFHGEKWAYGIRGQFDNFTHANTVLMAALSRV